MRGDVLFHRGRIRGYVLFRFGAAEVAADAAAAGDEGGQGRRNRGEDAQNQAFSYRQYP